MLQKDITFSRDLCNAGGIPLTALAVSFMGWVSCWGGLFSFLFGQVLDIEGAKSDWRRGKVGVRFFPGSVDSG